jgi:serine/threonine protein kinase/tetratricopeptide (TPR) repeat protein
VETPEQEELPELPDPSDPHDGADRRDEPQRSRRVPISMNGPASRRRFRIVRELGSGGMGVVYEAFDSERHARIAIKTLLQLTPDSLARFKREFRALQDIHHPNLVQLGELIAEGDQWFFTMELVEGADFRTFVRPGERHSSGSLLRVTPRSDPNSAALGVALTARLGEHEAGTAGRRFDEERLRACLRQLAHALAALHDAGMVHRDVKPSNIRVEPTGRLVLLDFGLVTESDGSGSTDHAIVGTPVYMAPEQAMARAVVGPEADLYAMGVLLFEALTGGPPFEGTGLEILLAKQNEVAPRAANEVDGIPPDLDDLCMRLLRREPAMRPTAAQVVRMLAPTSERRSTRPAPPPQPAPFVGRANELAELHVALADVRIGGALTVLVQGESGVGKSSLVKQFVESLAHDGTVCVLTGRCYEREAVPYKAFDGVVDSLTRFLLRSPVADVRSFLPTKPGPLVQVFPVLRRVAAIAQLTTQPLPPMDPQELRDRAFSALRELFMRLAAHQTVVIAIDDVQWADSDSVALLSEVLRPPEAPPLLFIGTERTGLRTAGTHAGSARLDSLIRDLPRSIPGEVRVVGLGRLPYSEARELAQSVLDRAGGSGSASAAWVAEEADGHPLFIDALARYSVLHATEGRVAIRLDDALAAPIARLEPGERRILELLAMSSAQVAQDVLALAAELDPDSFTRTLAQLRASLLITTNGARGSDTVELYHDRIRVAVKQKIERPRRQGLHQRLATALESSGSHDAQALAAHWHGAGDTEQAARYGSLAAEQAMQALAFDRAATLYDWALTLKAGSAETRAALYERLGDALANAGRGARAAAAYRKAAVKANATRALDLERRAADQLLRSGHIDEGLAAMRGVLGAIGMRLPSSPFTSLLTFLYWLVRLRVRGNGFRRRDTTEIAPNELTRIDTCWSVAFGLSITDPLRGATFQLRTLALSLRAGEPYRVARAMALHAGHMATRAGRRGWARSEKLLALAHSLAQESQSAHAIGWAHGAHGIAHYTNGHFGAAVPELESADRCWRETPGATWERDTMKMFTVNALAQLGRLRELGGRVPRYLREATERGDLYGAVNLRVGYGNLRWLVLDRADEARSEIDAAMGEWSKQGVHLEHFYELLARVNVALYSGQSRAGLEQLQVRWRSLEGALLFRVQSLRILLRYMRARLCLAEASSRGAEGAALLKRAERDARSILREKMDWSRPIADLIFAACAHARGDRGRAVSQLRRALAGFEKAEMALHVAATRARLGALVGGDEGRFFTAAAEGWMHDEGVVAPARMVAMMAPGFGDEVTRPTEG